jgi:hypothetical protein
MQDNIFNIPKPDEYECLVRNYNIGHSIMQLLVRRKTNRRERFYIIFSAVAYFSGSMRWTGANFCIKPDAEALEILRRIEHYASHSDEKLLATPSFKLYEVQTPNDLIQIVARRDHVHHRIEP